MNLIKKLLNIMKSQAISINFWQIITLNKRKKTNKFRNTYNSSKNINKMLVMKLMHTNTTIQLWVK